MTAHRNFSFSLLTMFALLGVSGCSGADKAPIGYGVVREHVISAPHNIPPIRSELDFTIIEIDGSPVKREVLPPLVDMQPGALVAAGAHHFKAKVAPHMRSPGDQPHEVSFDASVESEKIYYLVDKDGIPVLIEAHTATK
jgi:hypothetical protein